MLDDRFLAAWIPARHEVMGRVLPPFSLWHQLLLHAIQSPVIFDTANAEPADLILATRLCSQPWPIVAIRKRPTWRERYWHWKLGNPKHFTAAMEAFAGWVEDHMSEPVITMEDRGPQGPGSGVPFLLQIATTLLVRGRFTEREVWSMPYARALWYQTAIAAQEDDSLHVVSTEEEAEIRRLQALLDAMD